MPSSALVTFSEEIAAVTQRAASFVTTVHGRHRLPGSGIHWRKGVVVTVDHALRRDAEISVTQADGKRVSATLAGRDPSTDIAVLKVDASEAAMPEFADLGALKLGHIGLALGRTRRGDLVASIGAIGGLGPEWQTWRGGKIDRSIRLDLALYPGFSGGPLLSADGRVIGMNTNGLSRGRAVTIPHSTVDRIVSELLEKGHIARPYLGIAMQPVAIPTAIQNALKATSERGLLVVHVEPDGPAETAGILLGDIIVELAGEAVTDTEEIRGSISASEVGAKMPARLVRGGAPRDLTITLGSRPQ